MALKQLLVLLYKSLKSFEARVNHSFRLNTPFVVDLEVQRFSDSSEVIKPIGARGERELGQMVACLNALSPAGSTVDDGAWEHILNELQGNPRYAEDLRKGRAVEITTEITDGETNTFEKTQAAVRAYEGQAGAGAANAIKITGEGESDEAYRSSKFNTLFQGNGQPVRHPRDMTPAFAKLLQEKMAQLQKLVEVQIGGEGEEE